MIINWYGVRLKCSFAVNLGNSIILYDENYIEIQHIYNITYRDWPHISIEGGSWTDPSEIPTDIDRLQSDIDYLDMQTADLEKQDETNRADIDYCLMMLNDGAAE